MLANDKEINDGDEYLNGSIDCVDNTTNFLSIHEALDLLPEWSVGTPEVRNRIDNGLAHWTTVMIDDQSGEPWSIDSWFRPHGHLPYVMPRVSWAENKKGREAPYVE